MRPSQSAASRSSLVATSVTPRPRCSSNSRRNSTRPASSRLADGSSSSNTGGACSSATASCSARANRLTSRRPNRRGVRASQIFPNATRRCAHHASGHARATNSIFSHRQLARQRRVRRSQTTEPAQIAPGAAVFVGIVGISDAREPFALFISLPRRRASAHRRAWVAPALPRFSAACFCPRRWRPPPPRCCPLPGRNPRRGTRRAPYRLLSLRADSMAFSWQLQVSVNSRASSRLRTENSSTANSFLPAQHVISDVAQAVARRAVGELQLRFGRRHVIARNAHRIRHRVAAAQNLQRTRLRRRLSGLCRPGRAVHPSRCRNTPAWRAASAA